MLAAASRVVFHGLARIGWLSRMASRYGMAPGGAARRFIAGETVEDAIDAAQTLRAQGLGVSFDYLGDQAPTLEQADAATLKHVAVVQRIGSADVERHLSVKLTQLGLLVDRATATDNLRRVLEATATHGAFVRVDMEGSRFTDAILVVLETLWRLDYHHVGAVIQSSLLRSPGDVQHLNALGIGVCLAESAHLEARDVAHQRLEDASAAFLTLTDPLLDANPSPAFATHDPRVIDGVKARALARGRRPDQFEFLMRYGLRRDVQAALVAEGYRVRIGVPFGAQWFPHVMRRLGERPAAVGVVLDSMRRDRRTTTATR